MTTFAPGSRVLWQNDLRAAWDVVEYFGDNMLRVRNGKALLSAPTEQFIVAPNGYEDAPIPPAETEGRYDRIDQLDDPVAQEKIVLWDDAMCAWDHEHRQPLLKRLKERGR